MNGKQVRLGRDEGLEGEELFSAPVVSFSLRLLVFLNSAENAGAVPSRADAVLPVLPRTSVEAGSSDDAVLAWIAGRARSSSLASCSGPTQLLAVLSRGSLVALRSLRAQLALHSPLALHLDGLVSARTQASLQTRLALQSRPSSLSGRPRSARHPGGREGSGSATRSAGSTASVGSGSSGFPDGAGVAVAEGRNDWFHVRSISSRFPVWSIGAVWAIEAGFALGAGRAGVALVLHLLTTISNSTLSKQEP